MAKDNITPIYGEWLCKNLKYYQFSGKEAEDLKKRLEAIDVTNVEYDEELVICYRKFLQLFHNNMFEMAFCPPRDGITTTHIKAFLAPNAYGVMTPMEFLEENHSKVQYDFDEKAKEVQSLETRGTTDVDYDSIREEVDKITKWKKNKYANIFRGVIVVALVIFAIVKSVSIFDLLSQNDFQTIRICIAVILGIGAWKGLAEIFAGIRKKNFFKAVATCNSVFSSWSTGASEDKKTNSQLEEYKELLHKALIEGNPTEISGIFDKNAEGTDISKQLEVLRKAIKKNKRIKKRAGFFIFLFLFVTIYFLLYGYNNLLLQDRDAVGNHEEALSPTPTVAQNLTVTPTEVVKQAVAYTEKLLPSGAVASSELVSSKNGIVYGINFTLDDDTETCWQDGVKGDGTYEWLSYSFDKAYSISSISILNGRVISEEKYVANGRIKELIIYFNKEGELIYQMHVMLDDVFNVVHTIDIGEGIQVNADEIIIIIDSIYRGEIYEDLCVTEVSFTHTYCEYE